MKKKQKRNIGCFLNIIFLYYSLFAFLLGIYWLIDEKHFHPFYGGCLLLSIFAGSILLDFILKDYSNPFMADGKLNY